MTYRREIDGLRALAVVSVILCHAGLRGFSGGFIGVDVFFVISGFLITTIIQDDLKNNAFSITKFYLRRARRILPALYLVMAVAFAFGYFGMMPDEFKNFGQSVVATTLFSNNILLAITSGYWDLASSFKPLLHTWSLGVEEQYYLLFPIVLFLLTKWKKSVPVVLWTLLVLSVILANWWVIKNPNVAFYILPTRSWELLAGAVAAIHRFNRKPMDTLSHGAAQILSLTGLVLIVGPVVFYNQNVLSPGYALLAPVAGATLVILYAKENTVAHRFLGCKAMVGIGLMSYSLYLWHQPLLAFARIYSISPPSSGAIRGLVILTFILSYLSWKFVETPFRSSKIVSNKAVVSLVFIFSVTFISIGCYLNHSYGMHRRIFDSSVRIEDMDKRIYNERAFKFRTNGFASTGKTRVLIIGNSYGRDMVNMTLETFDTQNVEIVYRDDLDGGISSCIGSPAEDFFKKADVIVFASGTYKSGQVDRDIAFAKDHSKLIFFIGTKHFGYNLNWIIQLDPKDRANRYNPLLKGTWETDTLMAAHIPEENYVSLLAPVLRNGEIPITDSLGRMLSTDRFHLTKYGAEFFGKHVLLQSRYAKVFSRN